MNINIFKINIINKILYFLRIKHLFYFLYYSYIKFSNKDLKNITDILNKKKFFLITSTGRTGTTLFSKMLNTIDGAYIVHEPIFKETKYHRKAMEDPNFSQIFLKKFRIKEIYYRLQQNKCERYGEVNSALRRNIKDLKEMFPEMKIIHIVRNGKDVISSVLNRKTLLKGDTYHNLKPSSCIIDEKKWSKFKRFEKIAYLWATENKYMRENSDITVRFEDLITDYNYFKRNILEVLDLNIEYKIWEKYVRKKVNANKTIKSSNNFNKLSEEQKEFFNLHCSNEMKQNNYFI